MSDAFALGVSLYPVRKCPKLDHARVASPFVGVFRNYHLERRKIGGRASSYPRQAIAVAEEHSRCIDKSHDAAPTLWRIAAVAATDADASMRRSDLAGLNPFGLP